MARILGALPSVAEKLARVVLDTHVPPTSYATPGVSLDWVRLPPGIVDVRFYRPESDRGRYWHPDAGGWVAPILPSWKYPQVVVHEADEPDVLRRLLHPHLLAGKHLTEIDLAPLAADAAAAGHDGGPS